VQGYEVQTTDQTARLLRCTFLAPPPAKQQVGNYRSRVKPHCHSVVNQRTCFLPESVASYRTVHGCPTNYMY